jgi:hypothetical protein
MARSRREAARRICLVIPAPAETETQKMPGDVFAGHGEEYDATGIVAC